MPSRSEALPAQLVLLAFVALGAGHASAQEGRGVTATLSWTRLPGAEGCPTVVEIATGVGEILGPGALVDAEHADRVVEASVEPTETGFLARIRMADGGGALLGERTLEVAGCAELLETAPLIIALMIDPDAEPAPEPEPEPEPEMSDPMVAHLGPVQRLDIDLGGAATLGLGPFVSGLGYARALLTLEGFVPFGLVGLLQPFSRADWTSGPTDFAMLLAGVTICPLFLHDAVLSTGLCAGVDLGGAIVVGAPAMPGAAETERLLVQLDVSAYLRFVIIGPLAVHALGSFYVPFRTEAWLDRAGGVAWRPEPVAAMIGVGISLELVLGGDPLRRISVP